MTVSKRHIITGRGHERVQSCQAASMQLANALDLLLSGTELYAYFALVRMDNGGAHQA